MGGVRWPHQTSAASPTNHHPPPPQPTPNPHPHRPHHIESNPPKQNKKTSRRPLLHRQRRDDRVAGAAGAEGRRRDAAWGGDVHAAVQDRRRAGRVAQLGSGRSRQTFIVRLSFPCSSPGSSLVSIPATRRGRSGYDGEPGSFVPQALCPARNIAPSDTQNDIPSSQTFRNDFY
jgi:hypothetical protein